MECDFKADIRHEIKKIQLQGNQSRALGLTTGEEPWKI